nr:hypothetical protein CFP56_47322 [Quercus suber]
MSLSLPPPHLIMSYRGAWRGAVLSSSPSAGKQGGFHSLSPKPGIPHRIIKGSGALSLTDVGLDEYKSKLDACLLVPALGDEDKTAPRQAPRVAVKKDLTVKTELSGDNLIKYLPPPFNLNRSSSPSSLSLSQHTIRTPQKPCLGLVAGRCCVFLSSFVFFCVLVWFGFGV